NPPLEEVSAIAPACAGAASLAGARHAGGGAVRAAARLVLAAARQAGGAAPLCGRGRRRSGGNARAALRSLWRLAGMVAWHACARAVSYTDHGARGGDVL